MSSPLSHLQTEQPQFPQSLLVTPSPASLLSAHTQATPYACSDGPKTEHSIEGADSPLCCVHGTVTSLVLQDALFLMRETPSLKVCVRSSVVYCALCFYSKG